MTVAVEIDSFLAMRDERDRAREVAVALEQELAELRRRLTALADGWAYTFGIEPDTRTAQPCHWHPGGYGEDADPDCCICPGAPCAEVTTTQLARHFARDLRRTFQEEGFDEPPF